MIGFFQVGACALDVAIIAIHYFYFTISAKSLLSNILRV